MCGDDVQLISCSGCYLYLLTSLRHATVAGCTDCQIVLGAVSGAGASVCVLSPCRIGLALLLAVLLLACWPAGLLALALPRDLPALLPHLDALPVSFFSASDI